MSQKKKRKGVESRAVVGRLAGCSQIRADLLQAAGPWGGLGLLHRAHWHQLSHFTSLIQRGTANRLNQC